VQTFDSKRHAVIEASAGTGKTFTIGRLVLRLVAQEKVPLDKILVVTFTEKATGELKDRLRAVLEQEIRQCPSSRQVRAALDHFDQAPIFTIHGFCQRLLQEYPLEKGHDFAPRLVDDGELFEPCLREVQRQRWRQEYGACLGELLQRGGFQRGAAAGWETTVREVLGRFRPAYGHRLMPAPAADWHLHLEGADDAAITQLLQAATILQVQECLAELKRQRGLQSFDDMIARVAAGLDPQQNPSADYLLKTLRDRFHFGIVDEFQDTDPLQWLIFRRIFLEGGTSRLIVVGDPKQAIFAFRGADLPTYVQAVRALTLTFAAQEEPLTENWRSCPELLTALNATFGAGGFFPPETNIHYRPVSPPAPPQRPMEILHDGTRRAALSIIDLESCERYKQAQRHFARFVAAEVHALLKGDDGRPALTIRKKDERRPIQAGDVAVLVFRRGEAEPVKAALREARIPYTFYKEGGLWQSDEALHVEVLLKALSRPHELGSLHRVLLTPFFRIRCEDLAQTDDLPPRHPARELFQRWTIHAERREWAGLFSSLLEDTGLVLGDPHDPEAERRLANFRAVFEGLETAALGESLDLLGLLDWLRTKKASGTREAEGQVAPSEQRKVQIMTLHASKGLEFPVVFLAGGFTDNPRQNRLPAYRDEAGQVIFDLSGAGKELTKAQNTEELRRLLYVALTRAMFKLYVPSLTKRRRGTPGPAVTLLQPALTAGGPDKLGPDVAQRIVVSEAPAIPSREPPPPPEHRFTLPRPLFPALDPGLSRRRIVIRSFSSMRRPMEGQPQFGEAVAHSDEAPVDALAPDDPLRGVIFGDLVHKVLEKIDFAEVGRAATPEALLQPDSPAFAVLVREVRAHVPKLTTRVPLAELEQACVRQVASLVWHALHTPLGALGGPLWRILPQDRLHELEFHFPGAQKAVAKSAEERFFTGFIDLVVRVQERWFVVDWKTNLLPAYGPGDLARNMEEADYRRQYRYYWHALVRWLRRVHGDRFDFVRNVGGVYYLYVRGLNGADETSGVFFHQPTPDELALAEDRLP
jgi:exodeoxyribonuclease V beta subunit